MARYIDAEKIPYYIAAADDTGSSGRKVAFKCDIDKMPTANVRPERHGCWILDDSDEYVNHYHCSRCGAEKDTCNEIYDEPPPNYCEICGAKMDGKNGGGNE